MAVAKKTNKLTYAFLGPVGTFTELALAQVKNARAATHLPVATVGEAIDAVLTGRAMRAIVPVENSIEGGVSATLDALANSTAELRIYGEYLVDVTFNLVARPGIKLTDVRTIATHPTAWAQCRDWVANNVPNAAHLPSTSTAAAAASLLDMNHLGQADAAIAATRITDHYKLSVLAKNIGDNKNAQTRFIEIGLPAKPAKSSGRDKTSVIVELPTDRPGALLEMLEQFAARGVNLSRIESRPVGDRLGRYRFNIDVQGHIDDDAVAEALMGLHRFSPHIVFLGSYPRADKQKSEHEGNNSNSEFHDAEKWLKALRSGK
jgi:prephenate dehydratase